MGFARKVRRNREKAAHKTFTSSWTKERAYQLHLAREGKELPTGQRSLGRKPTFAMWKLLVTETRARQLETELKTAPVEEIEELEWTEEEKAEPNHE